MNFSLDTNIVIGVVNNKDKLHDISINLLKEKQTDHLLLCFTVLKESQTVLRNRINEIMVEIIRYLPNFLEISKLGSVDLHSLILEKFKQIRDTKPSLENFLNLVYEEIINFLKDNNIERLPSFLSQLSIRYSRPAIQKNIEETHSIFKIISLNPDNLSNVKIALAEIHFKNANDERIFQELMTNLNEIKPIEFFSDDREFTKKCVKGYAKIANDLGFDKQAFSCKLL